MHTQTHEHAEMLFSKLYRIVVPKREDFFCCSKCIFLLSFCFFF